MDQISRRVNPDRSVILGRVLLIENRLGEGYKNKMSKMLYRYWEIEYALQKLWNVQHHKRDYTLISVYNKEQSEIKSALRDEELLKLEDTYLTNH